MILVILGLIEVLAPLIYPDAKKKVQELLDRGDDPDAFDWVHWVKFYGRSTAELQAEVDAQHSAGEEPHA
jgi:hypothetical protein